MTGGGPPARARQRVVPSRLGMKIKKAPTAPPNRYACRLAEHPFVCKHSDIFNGVVPPEKFFRGAEFFVRTTRAAFLK